MGLPPGGKLGMEEMVAGQVAVWETLFGISLGGAEGLEKEEIGEGVQE